MFWERFISECERVGKKPNPVAKELGISSGTVTGWKNGAVPQQGALKKLADFFGCTTDYLIGVSDNRAVETIVESISLTEQEKTLLRLFRETTEEGRFEMIAAFMSIKKEIEKKTASKDTVSVG